MKIKISQCTNPIAWYKNKVGEVFELDCVELNEETQKYDAFLMYNKTVGSRYFVHHGDYEFVHEDTSGLGLIKRIELLEQQVKELQSKPQTYLPPSHNQFGGKK